MRERGRCARLWLLALAFAGLALTVPAGAGAATVVNGNFETGNLDGWHVHEATGFGNWFNYEGTQAPMQGDITVNGSKTKRGATPVPAPPQGTHAAIADQLDPDTLIMYQDIALAPNAKHQLSLQTYYVSRKPIAVPTPDTLSTEESALGKQPNQQYRIDIMRPEAPLESLEPGDVLRNVFSTEQGAPASMPPSRITANLTAFAGQTIRLRFAVVAGNEALNAGVDDVSITSTGAGAEGAAGKGGKGGKNGQGGGAALRVLSTKPLGNGSVLLRVHVPAAGRLSGRCPKRLVPASARVGGAKNVTLRLRPTVAAMSMLKHRGHLHLRVSLAFKPHGEPILRARAPVRLKLATGRQRR